MNSLLFNPSFYCLIICCFFASCKNDDDNSTNTPTVIQTNLQNGDWKITSFIDSDKNETNHFNGYNFTFGNTGILTAKNSNNTVEGTWSISDSNSDDDSIDDLHFNILFNVTNDFEDLNDDWDIISQTNSKIELIDVSGGNGGTDYLTFEKK